MTIGVASEIVYFALATIRSNKSFGGKLTRDDLGIILVAVAISVSAMED